MMWDALVERETGFLLFTKDVLEKIRRTRVLLVGCGGNGTVADLLVRAGFTDFGFVDGDVVEDTNLNRLPFDREAVGLPKTEAWRRHVFSINPEATVRTWQKTVNRYDGDWLSDVLSGSDGDGHPVDLVFLGTTDVEANLVVGRVCAESHTRMIIGPASSGSWIVGTFLHGEGDVTVESLAGFGTAGTPLPDIDYEPLRAIYRRVMNYPGRVGKLAPGVGEAMARGELAARSCGMFVRMTNAAMAFEAVKNVADMNGILLEGTAITALPVVQIFDPYSGAAYYYNILHQRIGIPNWLTGQTRWEPWQGQR
ncbi:MAG: ThiF family adenylyltransferase [Desulfovibrio sp.]|nr:ThiF family adenylyltransferase [Desulfovibrio sp.]